MLEEGAVDLGAVRAKQTLKVDETGRGDAATGDPICDRAGSDAEKSRRRAGSTQRAHYVTYTQQGPTMSCHETDNNSPLMKGQVLTTPQWSKARKLTIHQFMPRGLRPHRNLAVGRRLKLARMALGWADAQGKFAQLAGISLTAYNQWESGENYPGVDNAIKLCDKHVGLTLDWIYRGKMDGMPSRLSNAIQVLCEAIDTTRASDKNDPQPDMKVVQVPIKRRRKSA